jgi:ectoine hydroxylase-related dioxygenase (phytanoyl-CoA dioxygenase family)
MGAGGPVQDDGFSVVACTFNNVEVGTIGSMLAETTLVRSRAGARHLMRYPEIEQLAYDRRLLSIARGFLGGDPIPFRATFFDKSPQQNWLVPWHQDTALPVRRRLDVAGWGPWSIKSGVLYAHVPATALERVIALRVHIDDSCSDNGPLRVIPGTHRVGVLSDAEVGKHAQSIAPVECLVAAGGIVAMRPLIIHASSKASADGSRRVLHIEYSDRIRIEGGLELAIA